MQKKAKSPQHKDAAIASIKALKKKNQAKEIMNTIREETFLKLDPFTDTLFNDIAPIINEISSEDSYRFRNPEVDISQVHTAVSRMDLEILSATPGKIDNSALPADADVLRTFRRNPLVQKWRDDLKKVGDDYDEWKKKGESVMNTMCGELVSDITFTKEHASRVRGYYDQMKAIKKRVSTLRCSENDMAWFIASMDCMVWLVELYNYVQDNTNTAKQVSGGDENVNSNLVRFQSHLKKLKNCRNSLQAAVVSEELGSTVGYFTNVLEVYGQKANKVVEDMLEWNRQVNKVAIATTGDAHLDRALALQQEAEGFPLLLPGLREINNHIAEARQFQKDAEAFLAEAGASSDIQYHENSGLVGIDTAKLEALSKAAESIHLHTPVKVHISTVTQCIELLSDWSDVMNASSGEDATGRVQVSSLQDFLDNEVNGDPASEPAFLERLRSWRKQVMRRAKEMLDSAGPYITKAHKCLGKLTLENVSGLANTLKDLRKFKVICEEEPILVFIQQAHDLAVSAREALGAIEEHADEDLQDGGFDLGSFEASKGSLFPLEKLQQLQMSMNKAIKSGPSGFIGSYKRTHGKKVEAWVTVVETLVDYFRALTNDIANSLSGASDQWNRLSESLQLSADGAQFLSREQLLKELGGASGTGTLNDAVATKAISAAKAGMNKEGAVNKGLIVDSIEDANAAVARLERLQTECLFLPVSDALYSRVCRHFTIAKALAVTESLEQALDSGASIVGAIAVFKDLILDSEESAPPGMSGPNEFNMRLFDAQKSALQTLESDGVDASEVDKYLLEKTFSGKMRGAAEKSGGSGTVGASLLQRFSRLWWIAEARYLLEEHGDMAKATDLMQLAKREGIENLEGQGSYTKLQAAIKSMADFEARVKKAMSSLEAASKASDEALKDAPPAGQAAAREGKGADEEKLNVFAGAIRMWKEKLGSTSEDIEKLLKELHRSQRDSESQESSMDVDEVDSQGSGSSSSNGVAILKNTSIERELVSASRLCRFVRDGSKTYIDVLQAMLVEEDARSPAGASPTKANDSNTLQPVSYKLQLSIQKSAVVELKQLDKFIDSFRKLYDGLQESAASGAAGSVRGVGKLRLVTFLLELLSFYGQKAQLWLEQATAMVPVVATRHKANHNFRKNIQASDLEQCLKQPVARAIITDVHNTILKVLSDYESFNLHVKYYLAPGLVNQPEYAQYREICDAGNTFAAEEKEDNIVFNAVKEAMEEEGESALSRAVDLDTARLALLQRRKLRAEGLIDQGNRLSLNTQSEVTALQWAIKVIMWDREAGATAPGKVKTNVDQFYSLEKAEARERSMRGWLSQQTRETAKVLVALGVMREEQNGDAIAAVYNSKCIHSTILASIDQLQAIGKGVEAITKSSIQDKIRVHINTINEEDLSVTSEKFMGIKKEVQELYEEAISRGEHRTPQLNVAGVTIPPRRIVVGLPSTVQKQTDHILSEKFRDKNSLVKAVTMKSLRGNREFSQDDDSSASDSGDSSSDEDDGIDETEIRSGKRARTASEKGHGGTRGAPKGVSRAISGQAQAQAASAVRQEQSLAAANRVKRPPCVGFLCKKKRSLESSRYCSWACASDAANKLLPQMQQQRQRLLAAGGVASIRQDGAGMGSSNGSKGDKQNKYILNKTTAADRALFHPSAIDRQSVLQEMDDCVKSNLGPFGALAAGPTGEVDGDTDSEALSEGTNGGNGAKLYTDGDKALEKLLDSLAGTSSDQAEAPTAGSSDAQGAVAGSAILSSLPSAARNVVNPSLRADASRLSTGTAEFLLLGNTTKFKDPYAGGKNTPAAERRLRTQYRLRLEASLTQALERILRVNYAGTAAALALELEDELNSRFLDPEDFQPQEVFHTAQAKNEYKKKRQDMLREYGEKTSVLRKAFKEPHNDQKVREWLSGEKDVEDLLDLEASEFESAEAEKERERIRNEKLKAALRQDDKSADGGAGSDALTGLSQSEIAASAKRKKQQEQEEELRRRRKAEQESAQQDGDDGSGANDDMDVEPVVDAATSSRKRKANVDIGTSYAKQLKPAGVTVVDYTPGVGSNMRREGVGFVKEERDVLPYAEGAGSGSSSTAAAAGTAEKEKNAETKAKADAPAAKPAAAGKMLKKGKGILGILKAAPTASEAPAEAPAEDTATDSGVEESAAAPLILLSNKGNAVLTIQRAGAAPMTCFGKVASHDRGVQGVLDDHLHMEGRTKPKDLNNFIERCQRDRSRTVAPVLLTIGGDLTPDGSYASMARELTEPGKARAALMRPEGYTKTAKNNYEVYLIPPAIRALFPAITSREEDFARLKGSVGRSCTDGNCFYGLVLYLESGLQHYRDASEVVMTHASNAAQSVIASITSDMLFEPEEATGASEEDASSATTSEAGSSSGGSESADNQTAYASATAAFSASYSTGEEDSMGDSAYLVNKAAQTRDAEEDVSFDPEPAQAATATTTASSSSPSGTRASKAAAPSTVEYDDSGLSAEMRELLTKAADHCARNGVKTFRTMKANEQKRKVRTMPFLLPGQPGHELFKAEVVRREKELKNKE